MWKLLERFGVQGIHFVLQIYLARLLDPTHYGMLSMMVIFTTIANTFVHSGLNTALMQNKDVTEEDYSSVFWLSLGIAVIMYAILYISAPLIETVYKMEGLKTPLRVLALMLIPGAVNSVQVAKVGRALDFRKVFFSNIGAIVISGAIGITMAYYGFGVWALVAQSIANTMVACIVMWFTVRWRPRFVSNWGRIRVLFSFGWKLMVSSLLDTVYQDLRSLIIGLKYDSGTLGYYNRGKQFPQYLMNSINSAVKSVMLPAMSAKQDDKPQVKQMMRRSISLSAYIVFPMMAGLAGVSTPLIYLVLGEKWLPCVPYMIVYCCTMAFYPVHSCNLQAINAMGRSDLFLKLEIIKKSYGVVVLAITALCFDTPMAIALSGILTTGLSWFVNARPNKQLLGYSYLEQVRDLIPQMLLSLAMGYAVYCIGFLGLNEWLTLMIQIPLGVAIYVLGSKFLHLEGFEFLWGMVKKLLRRKKHNR